MLDAYSYIKRNAKQMEMLFEIVNAGTEFLWNHYNLDLLFFKERWQNHKGLYTLPPTLLLH